MQMNLPWRLMRPKFAKCDAADGMVLYESTFEEMRLYHRYSEVTKITKISKINVQF